MQIVYVTLLCICSKKKKILSAQKVSTHNQSFRILITNEFMNQAAVKFILTKVSVSIKCIEKDYLKNNNNCPQTIIS